MAEPGVELGMKISGEGPAPQDTHPKTSDGALLTPSSRYTRPRHTASLSSDRT